MLKKEHEKAIEELSLKIEEYNQNNDCERLYELEEFEFNGYSLKEIEDNKEQFDKIYFLLKLKDDSFIIAYDVEGSSYEGILSVFTDSATYAEPYVHKELRFCHSEKPSTSEYLQVIKQEISL